MTSSSGRFGSQMLIDPLTCTSHFHMCLRGGGRSRECRGSREPSRSHVRPCSPSRHARSAKTGRPMAKHQDPLLRLFTSSQVHKHGMRLPRRKARESLRLSGNVTTSLRSSWGRTTTPTAAAFVTNTLRTEECP